MRIAIIGAGGHGKVTAEIAVLNGYNTIHFFDDSPKEYPWPIIGNTQDVYKNISNYDSIFVAIGSNKIRQKITSELEKVNAPITILCHPESIISPSASIEAGVLIVAGAIINPMATIKKGAIINTGATIGHDVIIGEYVHIAPGCNLAGEIIVGNGSWLGVGSVVIQKTHITQDVYLGAGSLVIKDILESGLYFGSPATKQK